eukprot:450809_1
MSKKRSLNESHSESPTNTNVTKPPIKRQKLPVVPFQANSRFIWSLCRNSFANQVQFRKIFASCTKSQLSNKLHVPHPINQQIAEYATGEFKECYNCLAEIPTLKSDKDSCSINDYEAVEQIGYVSNGRKSCCLNCVNKLELICLCEHCIWADNHVCIEENIGICSICDENICDGCHTSSENWMSVWVCFKCNSKCHEDCLGYPFECLACHQNVSFKCGNGMCAKKVIDDCVCVDCYDGKMIKCHICDKKYLSISKGKYGCYLDDDDYHRKNLCMMKNCKNFTCVNCKEKCKSEYICSIHKSNGEESDTELSDDNEDETAEDMNEDDVEESSNSDDKDVDNE